MSIFVSIASYCDPLLERTIESIYVNAMFPDEIFVGVIDQSFERAKTLATSEYFKNIRYIHVDYRDSLGLGWARTLATSLYEGEDWYFQIDSHTIFDKDWDSILVSMAKNFQKINDKCILSSYPNSFKVTGNEFVKIPNHGGTIVHVLERDGNFFEGSSLLNYRGVLTNSTSPIKGVHLSGGCIFARGDFFCEVPYDPFLYFREEEQALAIRGFTKGWDIFHICDSPVYHLYHRDEDATNQREMHWDIKHDMQRQSDCWEKQRRSVARLNRLVTDESSLGVYGLGRERSLEEYKDRSGIDYIARKIEPFAYSASYFSEREDVRLFDALTR